MANDYGFGVSFLPDGGSQYKRQKPGQAGNPSSVAPVQEAIKILSLRMPRTVGANPLAPLPLLQGAGGGGLPEGMLQQLMRTQGLAAPNPGGPMAGPGQIGIQGASSPFLSGEGSAMQPLGELGSAPPVSVTAGATAPGGPGIPPTTQSLPPTPSPLPDIPMGGQAPDYWQNARRQRESMGRITY